MPESFARDAVRESAIHWLGERTLIDCNAGIDDDDEGCSPDLHREEAVRTVELLLTNAALCRSLAAVASEASAP